MTAATGPPAEMAANRDELTPMMAQYFELCAEYEESLVLFQVGDFYELFCEAAEEASRVLEITLTQREDSSGTYPMAGIPIDSAASYIETLLDAGYRVAIADQVQDPEEATGVVDRAVTRVVTPGTVVEDELLTAGTNNYVGALAGEYAAAFVDVSTGEFLATSGDSRATVADEIERLRPAELIVGPDVPEGAFEFEGMVTPYDEGAFDADAARETLESYVNNPDTILANEDEVRACGALLSYAEYTQGGEDRLEYVTRLRRYDPRDFVVLDATALRSLEVFENRERGETGTLFETLRDTSCALGRRKLTHWLRRPLLDAGEIEGRLDAVSEWTERSLSREDARAHLADVYDIERLIGRVSAGRANARDLRSLKGSLDVIPDVKEAMADLESEKLAGLRESLDELADVRDLIDRAVPSDPPIEITEGGVIARGFDDELDRLRETEREGREWVAELEAQERQRTGIDSLSVGFNQVHGYYIEVTNPNLDAVPDEYTRRQTLKNSERFYTPDLKRREDEILGAAERADTREYHVFREVRDEVAAEADRVQRVAEVLAELDVLATLAAVAVERDYVRPRIEEPLSASGDEGRGIEIRGGRHPVVETVQPSFVPNDADLVDERLAVITGPNMSGKSTYMRQIALIVVLAQMGSFVPADAARVPIVDRVFTRVGASDDIAGGQSTFMREMSELTEILHNATEDSLVLLDEVGRGTSTTDGLAIARAVTEFVHDEIGATTLFATHYHELTETADALDDACNLHFAAERADDDVTFLHAVRRGGASSSYGVEVARMAGVPDAVVERAYDLIEREREETTGAEGSGVEPDADGEVREPAERAEPEAPGDPPADDIRKPVESRAEPGGRNDVLEEIRELNIAELTPLEALNRLNEIKRGIDDADN